MTDQTLANLRFEAAEVADRTSFLHVLDTVILAVLVGIGWTAGRAWWLLVFGTVIAARGLAAYALAVQYGYRQGAKKPVKTAAPAQASAAPASRAASPEARKANDDDRILDQTTTPFGVPYGPNVQAFSQPA